MSLRGVVYLLSERRMLCNDVLPQGRVQSLKLDDVRNLDSRPLANDNFDGSLACAISASLTTVTGCPEGPSFRAATSDRLHV